MINKRIIPSDYSVFFRVFPFQTFIRITHISSKHTDSSYTTSYY